MSRITLPLAALAALTTACVPEQDAAEDYSWVLPGDEILVDLPTGRRAAGDDSVYLEDTREVAETVNGLISEILDGIGEITEFEPTWADDAENKALWGPWADGGIEHTVFVQAFDDGHYEWAYLGRPEGGSDDDWIALLGGRVEPGVTDETGRGEFAMDYDAIATLDATATATGVFASAYNVTESTVEAEAAFEGFSENGDPVIDAGYRYGTDADGGHMDVAYESDVTESGVLETVILRSRWLEDGSGRGDAYVTGGDFGPLVYQASECWNDAGVVVFDESNADFTTTGNVDDCAFAEAQWNEEGV